jgi:Mg2+ and Co2+ transporter CorA
VLATTFDGRTTTPLSVEQARGRPADAPFAWVDVRMDDPQDQAVTEMLTALGLTVVEATLARRTDVAGLFTASETGVMATMWMAGPESEPTELHVYWSPRLLLTVRGDGDDEITRVREQLQVRGPQLLAQPPSVLGVFLQLVLLGVDACITGLSVAVDEADQRILQGDAGGQLPDLRSARSAVQAWDLRLPRYADAVGAVLVDAVGLPGMDDQGAQHLKAYSVHLRDTIQRLHGVAADLRNAAQDYQTVVGNAQGDRINQLTVVSVLFLPVTFLTGYFGMNFQWLDDGIESLTSWLLLGVLLPVAIVAGSAYVLVRRGYSLSLGLGPQGKDGS